MIVLQVSFVAALVHTQYLILRVQDLDQTTVLYVENELPSSCKNKKLTEYQKCIQEALGFSFMEMYPL